MPVTAADTAEAVRETLTDRTKLSELMKDTDDFVDWIERSINSRISRDPQALDQVKEQTEAFMINWLRENQTKDVDAVARRLNLDSPNARARIRPNTVYNKTAAGAKHDAMFGNITEYL